MSMTSVEFDDLLDEIMDGEEPQWVDVISAIAQRLETRASTLKMLGDPGGEDFQTIARHLLITKELSAFERLNLSDS